MCIIIGDFQQLLSHCIIPVDPWVVWVFVVNLKKGISPLQINIVPFTKSTDIHLYLIFFYNKKGKEAFLICLIDWLAKVSYCLDLSRPKVISEQLDNGLFIH